MSKHLFLADEFVARYDMFRLDGKNHFRAMRLTSEEFAHQIELDTTAAPTFFFIDRSGCDYRDEGWDIHGDI